MSSHGILLETHHAPFRSTTSLYGMQVEQTTTDGGIWVDTRTLKDGFLEFANDGNSGGSISAIGATVMGSNALTIPDNSVDGSTIQTVNTLGIVALSALARWIKVKVTTLTVSGGATLGVRLHGHNF